MGFRKRAIVLAVIVAGAVLGPAAVRAEEATAVWEDAVAKLRRIGEALQAYRANNGGGDVLPPWLTTLVDEGYLEREDLTSPGDQSGGTDPHRYDSDAFSEVYEPGISFFYEFSQAPCNWRLAGLPYDPERTWYDVKMFQLHNGGDSYHEPGQAYAPERFPVVRFFWVEDHSELVMQRTSLNLAFDLETVFASDLLWESTEDGLRELPNPLALPRGAPSRIPLWIGNRDVDSYAIRRTGAGPVIGALQDRYFLIEPDDDTPHEFALEIEAVGDGTVLEGATYLFEFPDVDDDGLPDDWEARIVDANPDDGIELVEAVDPDGDFDGDGLANAREFELGTDPTAYDGVVVRLRHELVGDDDSPLAEIDEFLGVFGSPLFTILSPRSRIRDTDLDGIGLVILYDAQQLTSGEIAALREYVETGGRIWALGASQHAWDGGESLRDLLSPFGLPFAESATEGVAAGFHSEHPVVAGVEALPGIAEFAAVRLDGGTALVTTAEGTVIAAAKETQTGGRLVATGSAEFAEAGGFEENARRFARNARDWLCGTATFQRSLQAEWNLMSVPVLCADPLQALFAEPAVRGSVKSSPFWAWHPPDQKYCAAPEGVPPPPCVGGWVRSSGDGTTQPVVGLSLDSELELLTGWNLAGPPEPGVAPDCPWLRYPVWGWNAVEQCYVPLWPGDPLLPGHSYWFFATADCTVNLVAGTGVGTGGEELRSNRPRAQSPSAPPDDIDALVAGNTAFALALYRVISEQDGNLFASPYSISVALGMTYAGARAATETQMADTLRFILPQSALHPAFNTLDLELASRGEGASGLDGDPFRLHVVNQLWGQRDHSFLPAFLDTLSVNYGAGVRLLDFQTSPETCRHEINAWVEDQTEQRIRNLIPQGGVTSLTRLVLANAIYFKAAWASPFREQSTVDGPFFRLDGTSVAVPMMTQQETFPYFEGEAVKAVELPYSGGELSMVLLVPDTAAFREFENGLTPARLDEILGGLASTRLALTLPKFEFDAELSLRETLSRMGMPNAFANADFSAIDGTRELAISNVFHKAFVAVDEEGTEAAAATAVGVGVTSVPEAPTPFTVDRPFVLVIRDIQTKAILFIGRVVDPSPSSG